VFLQFVVGNLGFTITGDVFQQISYSSFYRVALAFKIEYMN